MHSIHIISLILLGNSLNAIPPIRVPKTSIVNSLDGAAAPEIRPASIDHIPADVVPEVLKFKNLGFKAAYELSLTNPIGMKANPWDRDLWNPLTYHDAKLDNQYALREWLKLPDSPQKSHYLKKLLENESVDFSIKYGAALDHAIRLGDLDNFKALFLKIEKPDQDFYDSGAIYRRTVSEGTVDMVTYIDENYPNHAINPDFMFTAVARGNLDMVKYLQIEYGFPDGIIDHAAISGKTDVLKYFLETEVETRVTFDDTELPLDYGRVLDDVRMERPVPTQRTLEYAATSGNLDTIKYLTRDKRMRPDQRTLLGAVKSGNLDMVQYISNKGLSPDQRVVSEALASKNPLISQYLSLVLKMGKSSYEDALKLYSNANKDLKVTKEVAMIKHDATKDNQALLRHVLNLNQPDKQNAYIQVLFRNPTVDFSIENSKAVKLAIEWNDLRAFKALLSRAEPSLLDRQVLLNEALNMNRNDFLRYLLP